MKYKKITSRKRQNKTKFACTRLAQTWLLSYKLPLEQTPLFIISEIQTSVASHWKLSNVSSQVSPTFRHLRLFSLARHWHYFREQNVTGFAVFCPPWALQWALLPYYMTEHALQYPYRLWTLRSVWHLTQEWSTTWELNLMEQRSNRNVLISSNDMHKYPTPETQVI